MFLFEKSSGHVFASHAINHRCLVVSRCPAFRIPKVHCENPAYLLAHLPTLGQSYPRCLGLIPLLLLLCLRLLPECCHSNKYSSRRVLAIFTASIDIGNCCCVCCKSPTLFGFFVELLLHLLLSQSVLHAKEDIALAFIFFMYFLSVLHANPFSKVQLNLLASFCILVLSFPAGCLHLFEVASVQLL